MISTTDINMKRAARSAALAFTLCVTAPTFCASTESPSGAPVNATEACDSASNARLRQMKWRRVCNGFMGDEWYGSEKARQIADVVLDVQKNVGGWMKNDQLHKLSAEQYAKLMAEKDDHACFDNDATTEEMRFLAKVWKHTGEERYRQGFLKALQMIFDSEKECGGWSQYWPLRNKDYYWDYVTFNDNLTTNNALILYEISENQGDFADIVDEATRRRCREATDRTIDLILKCQIDDDGVKSAWCAQYDPADLMPVEGRPHELPSVSGQESVAILEFLMALPDPSEEVKRAVVAGVEWLDAHKIEGVSLERYTNARGESDMRIVKQPGGLLWGRFIQLGGETGRKVYENFFNILKRRGKTQTYEYEGKSYVYDEEEIARASYRPEMAYQPIFAIYERPNCHLYYRFLYNYEDTPKVVDAKGVPVATSLQPRNRSHYQYLGDWPRDLIENQYPEWRRRNNM